MPQIQGQHILDSLILESKELDKDASGIDRHFLCLRVLENPLRILLLITLIRRILLLLFYHGLLITRTTFYVGLGVCVDNLFSVE